MENLVNMVKAAQANDYNAIEALYSAYSNSVYSIALKLSGSTDYAVNITQEVFIESFQKIGDLKQPEVFSEELKKITFLKCVKYFPGIESNEKTKSDFTNEINRSFVPDKAITDIEIPSLVVENILRELKQLSLSETPPVFKTSTSSDATAQEETKPVRKSKIKILIASIIGILLLVGVAIAIIFFLGNDPDDPTLVDDPDNSNRANVSDDSNSIDEEEENYIIDDYVENENFDFELEGFNREIVYEGDVFVIDTERIPHIHLGGANLTNEMLAQYLNDGTIPLNTTDLSIESNRISDISPLTVLSNMDWLSIQNNQISDISAISEFNNLRVLWAHNNNISDITPLLGLKNLDSIRLCGNPLSQTQITELRNALPNCRVRFDE
ncbi:MAG: hypothetical protein LBD23_15415 [Oscillospiraceae bacterium]|jgi:Leucine-rich repeat (LRR) protein|nr:hypothetical protein [Oscillospiraceae bacterium]